MKFIKSYVLFIGQKKYKFIKHNGYYIYDFKNSKTFDSHRLFLKPLDKIKLK